MDNMGREELRKAAASLGISRGVYRTVEPMRAARKRALERQRTLTMFLVPRVPVSDSQCVGTPTQTYKPRRPKVVLKPVWVRRDHMARQMARAAEARKREGGRNCAAKIARMKQMP